MKHLFGRLYFQGFQEWSRGDVEIFEFHDRSYREYYTRIWWRFYVMGRR